VLTYLCVCVSGSNQEKHLVDKLVSLYCDKQTHYNELASLYLTDPDTAIKQLFHFREVGDRTRIHTSTATFSSVSLWLFFVPYFLMACITCGCAIPAGLFVPSLLSGAALGRLVGTFVCVYMCVCVWVVGMHE
jgi:hypothetical protein